MRSMRKMLWFAACFSFRRKVEGGDEQEEWQEAGNRVLQALDVESAYGNGGKGDQSKNLHSRREWKADGQQGNPFAAK
jgi:hypothetical protein